MSTNRSRRIDHDTAEQLLGGASVGTPAGHADLAGLLAAAAAPAAGDGDLPGEREAMAAFREARRNPVPQPRRKTMADTAMARAFSAKAVAAAFAVTALGGVAVAAGGGLPAMLGGGSGEDVPISAHSASQSPSAIPGLGRGGTNPSSSASPSATGSVHPSVGPSGDASRTAGQVDDGTAQLCRLYGDRVAAGIKSRLVLADPVLAPLVKAAGGVEHVETYCSDAAKAKHDSSSPSADHTKDVPTKLPVDPTKPDRTPKPSSTDSQKNNGGTGNG